MPRIVIAKGGITSSDVATDGLHVRRAWVLGQVLPGVPVWRLEAESRFPGLSYVVFPGNVGTDDWMKEPILHFLYCVRQDKPCLVTPEDRSIVTRIIVAIEKAIQSRKIVELQEMGSLHLRLERIALNAWPALQQTTLDGWVLRFSRGYTKRANSVNPLFGSTMDVHEKVARCEQLYAEQRLPCIFRLTPFASPPGLDHLLEQRGYEVMDPSLVLQRSLRSGRFEIVGGLNLRTETLDDWMCAFRRLSGESLARHRTHRAMLERVPPGVTTPYERFFASLVHSGEIVACGMGVLEDNWFGLFDLIVAPQHRNKGYGTELVSGMLYWAQERGAAHAYLQVVRHNVPARRFYARLGFQEAYPYWYRVPPCFPPVSE